MSTFTNQAKNNATFTNQANTSQVIYMVSEALDYYLVGLSSDQTLVTQDGLVWTNQTKN